MPRLKSSLVFGNVLKVNTSRRLALASLSSFVTVNLTSVCSLVKVPASVTIKATE